MKITIKIGERFRSIGRRIYGLALKQFLAGCGSDFAPGFPLKIVGGENIKIGEKFSSMGPDYLYGDEGEITIGNNVLINTNVQIGASRGKIHIGNHVIIGANVVIRAADHGIAREGLIMNQPHRGGIITIEDDVWIGSNCVILRNVRLGRGCVVAAGAVVKKDVEPYSIVAGVPARKVTERV
jgi:galactoside O-acetyltransferase